MIAYCDRAGIIRFTEPRQRKIPDGTLAIMRGRPERVRRLMEATARHAYDGKTLLVPGVPEAADDDDALAALERFIAWAVYGKAPTPAEVRAARAAVRRSVAALLDGERTAARA